MGKDGAVTEMKGIGGCIKYGAAGDVRGQQIGRELNAPEGSNRWPVVVAVSRCHVIRYGLTQCLGQCGFARAGKIFQQYMAVRHQGDQGQVYYFVAANHLCLDSLFEPLQHSVCLRQL